MPIKRYPAELEYKRNPKLSREVVLEMMEWVRHQAHLPDLEEEDIILFIVSCQFDVIYAKKTLDFYYTFRTQHPELFSNRDPLDESACFSKGAVFYYTLPGSTTEGHKVLLVRQSNEANLSNFDSISDMNIMLCVFELMLYEEGAVCGWHIVYDMEPSTIGVMLKYRLGIVKNMINYLQNASPAQIRGIHIIKPNPFVTYFLGTLKPFLKKSIMACLHVHKNIEEIYKYVPIEILPRDYGGKLASVQELEDMAKNRFLENRDILMHNQNLRVKENLRPKKETSLWSYIWS